MLAELQKCPTLFSSNEHGIAMARMSADAQRLCVSATTINNVTIKKEYDEESLKPVKEKSKKGLSWDRFFEELQASFNNGKVNWQPGQKRLSCRFGVEGEGAEFELETDEGGAEDGQKVALEALLHYHFVHTHPKEIEKQLEEASKREAEARQSATDLEREEANLSSIIARAKEQDEVNKDKYARLQKELETALANKKSGGGELDDDEMICRARNPLQKKDHKDYDVELLRLVKSKWIAEVDSSPYNVVARPYVVRSGAAHVELVVGAAAEAVGDARDDRRVGLRRVLAAVQPHRRRPLFARQAGARRRAVLHDVRPDVADGLDGALQDQ